MCTWFLQEYAFAKRLSFRKIRKSLSAEEEGLDQRAQLLVGQAVHAHFVDQSILLFLAGDHVFSFSSVHFAQQVVVAFVGLLHAYVFKKRPARFDRSRLASLRQSPVGQMMVEGGLDGASQRGLTSHDMLYSISFVKSTI